MADELTSVAHAPDEREFVADEQPRPDTTLARLAGLKPLLGPGSTITAGNASGINDGACALLVSSESAVERWALDRKLGTLQLYDLSRDPGERSNLADRDEATLDELRALLAAVEQRVLAEP